jgi:DNA polymerase-3 subunit alpha (Gram-positive type)
MIIFDTETTGLLLPPTATLFLQPRIVELCVIELDDKTYEECGPPHTWLINPMVPMSKESEKVNGISADMVKDAPTFEELLPKITESFLGQRKLVAHNLPFDKGVLEVELRRLDAVTRFPWPPVQVCTVALTEHIKGFRMNLADMHEHFIGTKLEQTHRAEDDVRALAAIVRHEKW